MSDDKKKKKGFTINNVPKVYADVEEFRRNVLGMANKAVELFERELIEGNKDRKFVLVIAGVHQTEEEEAAHGRRNLH